MDKKSTVVVTGANSGMGKASSSAFASTGAKVLMLCRNRERGAKAVADVIAETGNRSVELVVCDLASFAGIRRAAEEIRQKNKRINVLLNNAGVTLPGYYLTGDGIELQFGVNHLGHFLLTLELIPLIKAAAPARIVNVASGAHKMGKIDFDDINLEKRFRFWEAYGRSKLANVLFTYELARRLEGTGVTVNCLHPGAVATSIGVNRDTGYGRLIMNILKPFFQSPEQGADTANYLSMSEEVEGVSGKYFYRRKPVPSSALTHDRELAARLWKVSEELTGISWENSGE